MTIKFTTRTLHGRREFLPGVALAFDDPSAEAFFKAAGWAEDTTDAPAFTYPAGSVAIDPGTTMIGTGELVIAPADVITPSE